MSIIIGDIIIEDSLFKMLNTKDCQNIEIKR